jgi:hypothetical protein
MPLRSSPPQAIEAQTAWPAACIICGAQPTRWRINLEEPDFRGRLHAHFCERHEANKDMLLAAMSASDDDV